MTRGRATRDAAALAGSQYLARGVLLARGVATAAALGPAGTGAWNALNLVLDYGSYASAASLQGLELRLPGAAARDPARARRLMGGAWTVVIAGGVLFALGLVAWLASGARPLESPWGAGAPLLMLAAAWLQLAVAYLQTALRAQGDFARVGISTVVQALAGGGLGLALVWSTGVWGLLGGWIVGSALAIAVLATSPRRVPLAPGSLREGLPLVRVGAPVFAFFLASLLLRSLDRLAFVGFVGTGPLGPYSLGLMAAGLVLYLPEAVAAVLYPRMAAAASGDRDPERTRTAVVGAHRALAAALPLGVGLGVLWIGPVIAAVLPEFAAGAPSVRLVVLGALVLSAATLPGYWLLARGEAPRVLRGMAVVLPLAAALVFGVAARTQRPEAIALAAAAGYTLFALMLVALAARGMAPGRVLPLAAASFVPAAWGGGLAWWLASTAPPGPLAALIRSLGFVAGYLPALWWYGRRAGWSPWRPAPDSHPAAA